MTKKSERVIIALLESIKDNTKGFVEEDEFYVDSDAPISIPKDVYKKICKELDSKSINFMGIT